MISVILVDDEVLTRAGVRLLAERLSDVEIVGEAANGRAALSLIDNLRPKVVLTDIGIPLLDGIELTSQLRQNYPEIGIVILTASADEERFMKAMRVGALGYLLKDSNVAELEIAIRAASSGQPYITPRMTKPLLAEYRGLACLSTNPLSRLTPRHREVLLLIVEGKTNKEIAGALRITTKTVEKHRTEAMQRLGVHNSAALVRCALQNGLAN